MSERKFYTVVFEGESREAASLWDDVVQPFGKLVSISARDEMAEVDRLKKLLGDEERADHCLAWVLERADSPTNAPAYWAAGQIDPTRSSAWTENHAAAVRFAREEDARNVAHRFMSKAGIEVRVSDHIWSA